MSDVAETGLITVAAVVENLAFLTPLGPAEALAPADQRLVFAVVFRGPFTGRVVLALGAGVAEAMYGNLTGSGDHTAVAHDDAVEVGKELANVIAGNLIPAIYGSEHEFHLDAPVLGAPRALTGLHFSLELAEGALSVGIEHD